MTPHTGGAWDRSRVELDVPGLSIAAGQAYKWFPKIVSGVINEFDNNEDPATICTLATRGPYPYQNEPFTLEAVSDNAEDNRTGQGLRRLRIQGLDENWHLQEHDVDMNGTTAVAVPGSWIRILRLVAVIVGQGTGNVNIGTVSVQQVTGGAPGTIMMNIVPLAASSLFCTFTVPDDFIGFMKTWKGDPFPKGGVEPGGTGQEPLISCALLVRDNSPDWEGITPQPGDIPPFYTPDVSSGAERQAVVPFLLPPRTDIEIRLLNVDINNAAVGGIFQCVLRRLTEEEQNGSEAFRRWIRHFHMFD